MALETPDMNTTDCAASFLNNLDRDIIESVLKMSGGSVLDFSNRTFADFFRDFGVTIDLREYQAGGTSKANRLRTFLKFASREIAAKVLGALLERRQVKDPSGLEPKEVEHYHKILARLSGSTVRESHPVSTIADPETELLKRVFKTEEFSKLPLDDAMIQTLIARMHEAHRCIEVKAYLAAVILCGSVLEGMCLGYGTRHPERVNRAFNAQYKKTPPHFHEWKLAQWIEVLGRLGDLSPNVEKFGQGLRDFRNYVHPAEQIAYRFSPDQHTARIGFQVVVAAAEDLNQAMRSPR
jgi:hypothetical protein